MPRPKDPRGRPYKVFTALVELADRLELVCVRAHCAEHAGVLASRQIGRATQGLAFHKVRLVFHGNPKVAT